MGGNWETVCGSSTTQQPARAAPAAPYCSCSCTTHFPLSTPLTTTTVSSRRSCACMAPRT
eukprot:6028880-Pyramimonas_sp.AAC.1